MSSKKELIEKRNSLATRADELGKASQERELTVAEMAELAEIRDSIRDIKKKLGIADKVDEITREAADATREDGEKKEEKKEEEKTDDEKAAEAAETRSFEAFLRSEALNLRDDVTPLSKSNNGSVIPKTIARRIIRKLYDISPILERSTKFNVKGSLAIPYYSEDETNYINVAFQGAEFTKLSANSGKFTSINLDGYVAGALSLISRSLINNVEFPIVDYVVEQMAYSIKRFLENVLLNGSGAITGQTGTVAGLTGVTLTTTAAAANAITSNDLISLQDSVKDMFQENAIWIMSPKTRTAIRQLKDNMGRYMLQDDISLPFGKSLLGKPIFVSDNMPEIGAGTSPIFYGDMTGLATKFSENMDIQVLKEKYADQHADGVIAWFEFDAKVQDAQRIAKLTMASASA